MVKAWRRVERGLWALFGLLLPVTSFPLVAKLSGTDMVAPAAGPVLFVLLGVSVLPRWLKRGRLPKASLPLLIFFCTALISCGLAFFLPVPLFRDQSVLKTEVKALFTLVVGLAFYLAAATWAEEEERVAFLLRWIHWGGLAAILWTVAQGAAWRLWGGYPAWMQSLHAFFSTRELYDARAAGLAFEPSWLAHQLNMLYLPLWAGASLTGSTVHRLRWRFVTLERALLAGGLLALVLSVSRVGLLAPLLCVLLVAGYSALRFARRLQARLMAVSRAVGWRRGLVSAAAWAGIALVYLGAAGGLFLGVGFGLSKYDPRMATMFDLSVLKNGSFAAYANRLVFAERVLYWEATWKTFNDYPWLGVGLGTSPFFIQKNLSAYAWSMPEVRVYLYYSDTLLNSKSLWLRLLAETGLIGSGFFLSFLYLTGASALALLRRPGVRGVIGLAGVFALTGLLSEGMSIDTFALPYFWITFALAGALARNPVKVKPSA